MAKRVRIGESSKAIGIVRVSTSKQDIGAAAQRAELERWAVREGVELLAIFEDIGVSGAVPLAERPGLIAALAAVREFHVGKLVAVKRDRFARHRHTIADLEREVRRAGAVLVTADGTCTGDDSESEEVNTSIQDLVAALELRKIRKRNLERARQCITEGRTHGGDLPYGFRRKADGLAGRSGAVVEMEPDPDEQRAIELMTDLSDRGLSLRAIARALDEQGQRRRDGGQWQAMSIKRVLDRRANAESRP